MNFENTGIYHDYNLVQMEGEGGNINPHKDRLILKIDKKKQFLIYSTRFGPEPKNSNEFCSLFLKGTEYDDIKLGGFVAPVKPDGCQISELL